MTNPTPINFTALKPALAVRPRSAHKGSFGHVLIVGGDIGMAGAVRLAGEAALRVGAGLVSIATRPEHVAAVVSGRPELMCHGIKLAKDLKPLITKASLIILGPGLGQSTWSKALFKLVMATSQPKIIDADGLNLLAKQPKKLKNWILTPHPGEAARLLKSTTEHIEKDRIAAVQALQKKYNGIIVLKGAGTLVASTETLKICEAGNPGMATGGMGDVLSGVIGGLVAQHIALSTAAELGVYLHACAGDLAAHAGERGLIASDLMPHLRQLVNPL